MFVCDRFFAVNLKLQRLTKMLYRQQTITSFNASIYNLLTAFKQIILIVVHILQISSIQNNILYCKQWEPQTLRYNFIPFLTDRIGYVLLLLPLIVIPCIQGYRKELDQTGLLMMDSRLIS